MMLRVAFLIVFFAVGFGFAAASPTSPRKFDEFGAVGHCDLGARLDNFAIQLMNEPTAIGHVVVYGPEGEGVGSGRQRLKLIKDYLTEARGLPGRRIKTIYAGRNHDLIQPLIQLWITQAGFRLPEPPKFETDIETFKGRFNRDETEDFIDLVWADEGMGPGIGIAVDAAFADMLREQKKAIAYIVSYNGERSAPGSAKRAAHKQLKRLRNEHKVELSRVKTIFGGIRKKTTLELWILAPGDPPPATDAGPEPPPTRNVEITSQGSFILGFPENERAVFNRMLEVLRDQPTVKAVMIVSLEGKQPEPETEPEPEPESTQDVVSLPPEPVSPPEEEHSPVDLPKLVEKWRLELINTHKIRPDRVVVLFTTAPSHVAGNYLELWAMPPGQPLPDPNADDEKEQDPEKDPPVSDVVQNAQRRP